MLCTQKQFIVSGVRDKIAQRAENVNKEEQDSNVGAKGGQDNEMIQWMTERRKSKRGI